MDELLEQLSYFNHDGELFHGIRLLHYFDEYAEGNSYTLHHLSYYLLEISDGW